MASQLGGLLVHKFTSTCSDFQGHIIGTCPLPFRCFLAIAYSKSLDDKKKKLRQVNKFLKRHKNLAISAD